jgi:hypothetical protein
VPMGDPTHEHPEEFSSGDGPGSTGPYSFEVSWHNANAACGHEPDDTIELATDTGLIDQGSYMCTNSFMGDSLSACGKSRFMRRGRGSAINRFAFDFREGVRSNDPGTVAERIAGFA